MASSRGRGSAGAGDNPDALAAQIERTREELAETVDAIVERVSPKRVADRTRQKALAGARQAAVAARDRAGSAASAAREQAEQVRAGAGSAAAHARDSAAGAAASAREVVGGTAGGSPTAGLSPLGGPATGAHASPAGPLGALSDVPREYLAAGAALLLMLVWLVRRRS